MQKIKPQSAERMKARRKIAKWRRLGGEKQAQALEQRRMKMREVPPPPLGDGFNPAAPTMRPKEREIVSVRPLS
jgi:hypothetical protein